MNCLFVSFANFFFFFNNSLPWLILRLAQQLPFLVPLDKTEKYYKYCHVVVINHVKRTEGMKAEKGCGSGMEEELRKPEAAGRAE